MTENITIGTVGYPIAKQQMLSHVDMVEMTESRHIPPGKKAARHLKKEIPGNVGCTVQISRYFVTPPPKGATLKGDLANYGDFRVTDESMGLWKRQLEFAVEMNAQALVLITPSSIRPSAANVNAMSRFFEHIQRGGLPIIWEAHGPWEREQIFQFATANGLVPAVDPLRDEVPKGDLAYFRFGAFAATGSRMGVYELEQIVATALDCEAKQAFCVFDTHRALDDARNLKKVLSEFGADEFDEFDYDFKDDEDTDKKDEDEFF